MPKVTIEMFEGRTIDQKRGLVQSITESIIESLGVKRETVDVIIRNIRKEDWGKSGRLVSDQ